MAPAITSPRPLTMGRNGSRLTSSISNSRETTPTVGKATTSMATGDAELASAFKSDLTNLRNLVTCSICDQLLYEPWTLGCGHTYCYSCLCSWFVPNKKKKTCPECRTTVKQMPAPAFLVKQMVEIFIKRGELMPSDESIDQHQKKRAEEIADVDKDRNGADGLFKGTFPTQKRELIFDDGDGVYRCPRCLSEHEGGPTCANCDLAVEHDFLSDVEDDFDPDDLENLEVDLDDDLGGGLRAEFRFAHIHHPHFGNPLYYHDHDEDDSEDSGTDSSELDRDEDDDDSSLREFVVPDDEEPAAGNRANQPIQRQPINISDDDSDEGEIISSIRRRRRAGNRVTSGSSSPSAPSIVSVSSSSVSEANEAMLQRAGWSPLDQGNESDLEGQHHYPTYTSEEEQSDGSETETIGNGGSDDSDRSETPRYEYPLYDHAGSSDGEEDNDSEIGVGMDRDGDTEMSVSPSTGRYRSTSAETDGYGYGEPQSRSVSIDSLAYGYGAGDSEISRVARGVSVDSEQYGYGAGELGSTNQIHDLEDDSSDSSAVPPPRRHRRQHLNPASVQQYYDPRISVMLAEHQQIRGAQDPQDNLAQLENQMRRAPTIEPASRNRRLTSYRRHPSRRMDPLRSSRSPSGTQVISSSNRSGRLPPLYSRRN